MAGWIEKAHGGRLRSVLNAASAFVEWLSTLDQSLVLLFTFLTSAVEMTFLAGLLVPGESVVMLAAALPDGPAGFAVVIVVGTAGALAGQILGYAVGRAFGPRLRTTRLGRRIGAARFDRAEAYLRDRGAPALVAVRFVAVIHAVVPIVAGTVRMPFGRFVLWSGLGTALWVSAFATAGALTAGADATGGLALVLTAVGATLLGVLPFAARLVRRAFGRPAPSDAGPARPVAGSASGSVTGPAFPIAGLMSRSLAGRASRSVAGPTRSITGPALVSVAGPSRLIISSVPWPVGDPALPGARPGRPVAGAAGHDGSGPAAQSGEPAAGSTRAAFDHSDRVMVAGASPVLPDEGPVDVGPDGHGARILQAV